MANQGSGSKGNQSGTGSMDRNNQSTSGRSTDQQKTGPAAGQGMKTGKQNKTGENRSNETESDDDMEEERRGSPSPKALPR